MLRLPNFHFHIPATVAEAVALKAEHGPRASYVAGGTDLYPNMKRRQQEPHHVIQISHLEDLHAVREEDGRVRVGAGLTLTAVHQNERIARDYPALAEAAESVATPLLRNMGTLGGNLCLDTRCNYYDQSYEWRKGINFCMKKDGDICWVAKSSPKCLAVSSTDTAPVAVALGAEIEVTSSQGETRRIPAGDFFRNDGIDYMKKEHDELVTSLHLPAPNGWRSSYVKLRRRGSFDFPVLGVAVYIKRADSAAKDAPVEEARIVLGAVFSEPTIVHGAADALVGRPLTEETIEAAADAAFKIAKPMDNTDYLLSYRKEMVKPFTKRALRKVL